MVIPSEVENGAAGEAATWTGRPEAERAGSKRIKPRGETFGNSAGSFDFAQDDGAANSTAKLIAAIMLSARAIPFPAISNAVP